MAHRNEITTWRGATIGVVSGVKGGACAGALGGAVAMGFSVYQAPPLSVVIFALVMGVTFGGMAGVIVGVFQGGLSGLCSAYLLYWQKEHFIHWVWLGGGILIATLIGFFFFPARGGYWGALCGFLAGWVGRRDFMRIIAQQNA